MTGCERVSEHSHSLWLRPIRTETAARSRLAAPNPSRSGPAALVPFSRAAQRVEAVRAGRPAHPRRTSGLSAHRVYLLCSLPTGTWAVRPQVAGKRAMVRLAPHHRPSLTAQCLRDVAGSSASVSQSGIGASTHVSRTSNVMITRRVHPALLRLPRGSTRPGSGRALNRAWPCTPAGRVRIHAGVSRPCGVGFRRAPGA